MKEMRDECKEFESKKEERHRKRMERLNGKKNGDSKAPSGRQRYSASTPDLVYDYPPGGPRYIDDNPYAAGGLPPPPVGGYYRR